MNTNLITISQRAHQIVTELCEAHVTILEMRIDMDYDTPMPHTFRFRIQAWNDESFALWVMPYVTREYEDRTVVPFLNGQVFAIHD